MNNLSNNKSIFNKIANILLLIVFVTTNSLWPIYSLPAFAKRTHKAKKNKSIKNIIKKSNTHIVTTKMTAHPMSAYEKALKAKAIKHKLVLANDPSDSAITNCGVLPEPLIPMAIAKVVGENNALAKALTSYDNRRDDLTALKNFITKYPNSRWVAAIDLNLGLQSFNTGYLSDALTYWQAAWEKSATQIKLPQTRISESAISQLLQLEARLGRTNAIKKQLAQIKNRPMHGSNEARIFAVKQGLYAMEHTPQVAYKCGPYAVGTLYLLNHKNLDPRIKQAKSTSNGTNFKQVKDLANALGMKYQVAKRENNAPFIVPCIMHWKVGHFAAITKELSPQTADARFVIKDPTFDSSGTISASTKALESQSDGYFLVPAGQLPQGWVKVSDTEAANIWGKGNAGAVAQNKNPGTPQQCPMGNCGNCNGMPKPTAWSAQAELNISDTPLSYSPTIGPQMAFSINYNQNEGNQPSSFSFSNLTFNWSCNWVSHLSLDGNNNATVSVRGGGYEVYTNNGTVASPVYGHELMSQALLVYISPGVYQRQLPDGTIEVFNLEASGYLFMTQVIDPQGNVATINYDTSTMRVNSVTDPNGRNLTFSYVSNVSGNSGYYLISGVTDPFGRSISFNYDPTNSYMVSMTDAAGNTTQLGYGAGTSFVNRLTTPYGTTLFTAYTPPGLATGLRFNFPDGTSSVIENWLGETKQTYFWDRQAQGLYPNDPSLLIYSHCKTTRWLWQQQTGLEIPIPNWVKEPLESKKTYFYDNESIQDIFSGVTNRPIEAIKMLDGAWQQNATITGTPTANDTIFIQVIDQAFPYGNETVTYTITASDTLTTIAQGVANAINNDAQCIVNGVTAKSSNNMVHLSSTSPNQTTYNGYSSAGRQSVNFVGNPNLKQTIALAGTVTAGDTISVIVSDSALTNGSETVTVTAIAGDSLYNLATRLTQAINNDTNLQNLSLTAQTFGNNVNCLSYSANNSIYSTALSTGATEQISITGASSSTTLQTWFYQWNVWGKLTQSTDPIGRTINNTYAANGIDKLSVQAAGPSFSNYTLASYSFNNQHEPLTYRNGSAQLTTNVYNVFGQPISVTDSLNNTTTSTFTGTETVTLGGSVTTGDVLTINIIDSSLASGQLPVNYAVASTDTLSSIAANIASLINNNSALKAIGVNATTANNVLTLKSISPNGTSYTSSVSSGATETIALSPVDNGYLTQVNGPMPGNNDVTNFVINPTGTINQLTNSLGYKLNFAYDNLNRLLTTTYPDGTSSQNVYQYLDLVFATDRMGRTTQYNYDSMEQLAFTLDALGRKTQFNWCNCGSLAAMTDANGNTTNWHHDIEGRLLTKTYSDGTSENYTYENNNSRLNTKIDPKGQVITLSYNIDDTVNTKAYANAQYPTSNVTYTYDPNFKRLTSVQNGWGGETIAYNAYAANPNVPILGGGQISGIYNNVIANSAINFDYDPLGRNIRNSVNVLDNQVINSYDQMSRLTSQSNQLGTFNYNYVNNNLNESYGDTRLSSILSPNGQTANFGYYGTKGDLRLKQIATTNANGNVLSQYNYGYDATGLLTRWMQQHQNASPILYQNTYDKAIELIEFSGLFANAKTSNNQNFAYDKLSNRTSFKNLGVESITITGTASANDVLTITINNSAISGGSTSVSYTVAGSDTLNTIAAKLASLITTNINLNNAQFNAYAANNQILVRCANANATTYTSSTSSGATEKINIGLAANVNENMAISGAITAGDILTLNILDSGLSGGKLSVSYTVASGDTLNSIAANIASLVNSNTSLQALNITASNYQSVVNINSQSPNVTIYTSSLSANATETIDLSANLNVAQTNAITGTVTASDVITLNVNDLGLSGNSESVSYTVQSGDTLTSIATNLAQAINADTNLSAIGVSASSNAAIITLNSNSLNLTSYLFGRNNNSTESIISNLPNNGTQTLTIGGTITAGNTLTLNVYDAGLTNDVQAITYTVASGDTLNSIASNLASAIVSNSNLQSIGVTAQAINNVVNITSASVNLTTYNTSTSANSTETLALGLTSYLNQAFYNNLNQMVNQSVGGQLRFSGNVSKALNSLTITSPDVNINASQQAQTSYETQVNTVSGVTSTTTWFTTPQATNGQTTATITGNSVASGNVASISVFNDNLASGQVAVNYTITSSDTFSTIATNLANLINANASLKAIGLSATASNNQISLKVASPTYTTTLNSGATETATFGYNNLGNTQLTISGSPTANDTIKITAYSPYLSGGTSSVTYTVTSTDTLNTIAANIASLINSTSAFSTAGITANSANTIEFSGQSFNTAQNMPTGATNATLTGIDANSVQTSDNVQVNTYGTNLSNLTFDLNGNMTYDGNNNYQYDAQDRLVMITYSGTGNNTQFTYDGLNHWVKSVETTNNAVTSTTQYLWSGDKLIEELDGSGNVLKRFFDGGEQVISGGTNNSYYYVRDHLGSIRQMTNASGTVVYEADYDAYGTPTTFVASATPSFGYAGYFVHARSGLDLTVHRAYSSNLARFLNRDPIAESGGINLYGYVGSDPLGGVDPSGLRGIIELLNMVYNKITTGRFAGPWYGNWGGPYYANGHDYDVPTSTSEFAYKKGQDGYQPPKDAQDYCYYLHDICQHDTNVPEANRPHDPKTGQCTASPLPGNQENVNCNHKLADCLEANGGPGLEVWFWRSSLADFFAAPEPKFTDGLEYYQAENPNPAIHFNSNY